MKRFWREGNHLNDNIIKLLNDEAAWIEKANQPQIDLEETKCSHI